MITLENIILALEASWSRDTAYDKNDWSSTNPARGQCVVSSLVIQDYLGGELIKYSVKGEGLQESHYANLLTNGTLVDSTRQQYNRPVSLSLTPVTFDGYNSIREKRLSDRDTRRRYEILKSRVGNYLDSQKQNAL